MLASLVACASVVVSALPEGPKPPKGTHIPSVMRALHMKGRQTYRSLDQLLISGRSTLNERELFAEFYESLRLAKPPQGTVESWQHDIDRVLGIVGEMNAAKDEETMVKAGGSLLRATDCAACHEKYRYAPKPGAKEVVPKSLEMAKKAIAAGGKEWSAPDSLKEHGYGQPGRRLLVWPGKIEYYPAREAGKHTIAQVRFDWVLLPGAEIPAGSPSYFYYHHYEKGSKSVGFQFTSPHGSPPAREGSFTVNFDVPKEGKEVSFVLLTNWTVPVPLGNFVVLKLRPPG
jgi:hypothetical protein